MCKPVEQAVYFLAARKESRKIVVHFHWRPIRDAEGCRLWAVGRRFKQAKRMYEKPELWF